jgi:hypothetical protein
MANAAKDQNLIPTILGTSNADGATPVRVKANPTSHGLDIDDDTTGSDLGPANAPRDGNFIPALIAVSSVDGVTPVVVYADPSNGKLLVKST